MKQEKLGKKRLWQNGFFFSRVCVFVHSIIVCISGAVVKYRSERQTHTKNTLFILSLQTKRALEKKEEEKKTEAERCSCEKRTKWIRIRNQRGRVK